VCYLVGMRVKGSCQFSTYYRLQVWNEGLCVWKPVKVFPSQEEAESRMQRGKKYRLWEISMDSDPVLVQEGWR